MKSSRKCYAVLAAIFFLGCSITPMGFAETISRQLKSSPSANSVFSFSDSGTLPGLKPESLDNKNAGDAKAWLEPIRIDNDRMTLVEGRSHYMKFKSQITRISVSNPAILDFLTLSSSELLLNAKSHGSVNLMIWDVKGKMSAYDINVIRDPGLLDQLLKEIDPQGEFEIFPSRNVFVVRGFTSSIQKQKYVEDAVKSFAPGSVSLVRIKNIKQILLQIRFVQVDSGRDHQFGLDLENIADFQDKTYLQRWLPGATTGGTTESESDYLSRAVGKASDGTGGKAVTYADTVGYNSKDVYQLFYSTKNQRLTAFIKAKEDEGIAKTIARPNLLAKDGEEATFLVGGEVALLAQGGNGSANITYKEFGTRLKFKPEIMEDGEISLEIEPEVSQTNAANGVTSGTITIPGFSTTKVKTVVQLKDGETLLLGGMIQQKLETTDTGVPYFRRVPVIGKLFQSMNHTWQETELLIIVTPKIIAPEKKPITNDPKDLLHTATGLFKPASPIDERAKAIKFYLDQAERWKDLNELEGELDKLTINAATELQKESLKLRPELRTGYVPPKTSDMASGIQPKVSSPSKVPVTVKAVKTSTQKTKPKSTPFEGLDLSSDMEELSSTKPAAKKGSNL